MAWKVEEITTGGPTKYYRKKKIRRWKPDPRAIRKPTELGWQKEIITGFRAERERQKLSQAALGHLIGSNQAAVSLFELGLTNPRSDFLARVAEALQLDIAVTISKKNT